jgi:hypothetical protein
VARLADRDVTSRPIARKLVLSVTAIERHLGHARARLVARSQARPTAVLTGDLAPPGARTR